VGVGVCVCGVVGVVQVSIHLVGFPFWYLLLSDRSHFCKRCHFGNF
jgi:hypothetical protein